MPDDKSRPCKDCKAEWAERGEAEIPRNRVRPAPYSGPRCKSHHYKERERRRKAAHERRVGDVYGLPPGAYDRLYAAQGGKCAMPGCRATGKTKRLAVDHDHSCCSGKTSCGKCVRGLLCTTCNDILAHVRDSADRLAGYINYLTSPPARSVLHEFHPMA